MDEVRRVMLQMALEQIENVKNTVQTARADETEYRDGLPEEVRGTVIYKASDNAVGYLTESYAFLRLAAEHVEKAANEQ